MGGRCGQRFDARETRHERNSLMQSHVESRKSDTNAWLAIVALTAVSAMGTGCNNEASQESAADPEAQLQTTSHPTTVEPAPAKVGGDLTVNYSFIGFENKNIKVGNALAYFRDDSVVIELASDNLGDIDCGHNWNLGRDVAENQLAVVLKSRGMSYNAQVKRAVGTYEHLGYTYYYRRAGFDSGTNSGNSAREDADTELEITAITESSLTGRVRIRDHVQGTFVAKICP